MFSRRLCWLLVCLFIAGCESTYVAELDSAGLTGSVSFRPLSGAVTELRVMLGAVPSNPLYWELRALPVRLDRAQRCSDAELGTQVIYNISATAGQLSTQTLTVNVSSLPVLLFAGRSLVLYANAGGVGTRHCGTVLPSGTLTVAEARLSSPTIAGRVRLVQGTSPVAAETTIEADLYFSDGASPASSVQWKLFRGTVDDANIGTSRCGGLTSVISDLTLVLGTVTVAASPGASRTAYITSQVSLVGANSAVGNAIGVLLSGNVIACANVYEFKSKTVRSVLSMGGVSGSLVFTQASPIEKTYVQVTLSGLASNALGYHIHELPLPRQLNASLFACSAAGVGGHWNPYGITSAPSPAVGTSDQYEIGDLSGKFGTLTGLSSRNANYTDWNLPLFGPDSVVGRSVVVHYAAGGARWACADIGYSGPVVTAVANFRYPVIGRVILKQLAGEPWTDTSVYTELAYADNSAPSTQHNMHTHVEPNGADYLGGCTANQGHYNPFAVSVSGTYTADCSAVAPERCELGDISKKTGQLSIGSQANYWARGFWTDETLPLSGALTAVGRSLVIHAASGGAPRLACADVLTQNELRAATGTWRSGAVAGSMTVIQANSQSLASISVMLQYPAGMALQYHVHELTVPASGSCASSGTGGHYNPLNVNILTSPAPGTGTLDQYEVGDLSGKFGLLSGTSYSASLIDSNLQLFGPTSVAQRSLVVHQPGGARYACASLKLDCSSLGATTLRASATFSGVLQGSIDFMQLKFADGTLSDTYVEIELSYGNSTVTTNHGWHVHEQPVSGSCSTTQAHYNPFNVSLSGDYNSACSFANQARCELGDLSGKHTTYDIGGGRQAYTDEHLPLSGQFSIAGRSVVVHAGAARLACADIVLESSKATSDASKLCVSSTAILLLGLLVSFLWT